MNSNATMASIFRRAGEPHGDATMASIHRRQKWRKPSDMPYIPRARGGPIDFGQSGTYNAAPGDWNSFNEATAQMHKEASRPFGGPKKPKAAFIPLAKGGAMRFGRKPYLVGEKGEEFIFPRKDGSGFVIPADVTAQIKPALEAKAKQTPFNRLSRGRQRKTTDRHVQLARY